MILDMSVFGNAVTVFFQSNFLLKKIYQNNIFLKIIFDISASK
jgi:hypothetical protein